MSYRAFLLSGLLWIGGPVWADEDWCIALGDMARASIELRDAGVSMDVCLRHVQETGAQEMIRKTLRAQCYAAYESGETPEQARDRAIRICREAEAQVDADMQRLHD